MTRQRRNLLLAAALASACAAGPAHGQFVDNDLSGNVEYDGWESLTSTTPGLTTAVLTSPSGFGSFGTGSGDATLRRVSGAHYPAGVGLYSFSANSTFEIADTSAFSDVQTVVFSIQTWPNPEFGDGSTPAGSLNAGPTLNFNGGSQALTAGYTGVASAGASSGGGFDVDIYNYTFQWDLSSVGDNITSIDIDWGQIIHTSVVKLQLESADAFSMSAAVTPVPEPSTYALLALGGLALFATQRYRRKSA